MKLLCFSGPRDAEKTTTLRLTNRLETLTRGGITIEDQNIMDLDVVQLRQRLGYVIQAIGLFPNKTIAENIAVVPKLLRWDEERISKRIDELLEMTNLDPELYRDRYPAELSGGAATASGGSPADLPQILKYFSWMNLSAR